MAQDLSNFRKRCTPAEHPGGQTVAQEMGAFACRRKPSPGKGPADDVTDSNGTGKPLSRCFHAKEYPS